ncbi:MAG: ATP-binding protein [Candidatus Obscuribacterales bacterium]|nr:ATP-binding protein [Candidatus Obscuribacterales bacterium]
MLESLRWRLTIWFVALSLLLYGAGAIFGIFVLSAALTTATDDELRRLLPEIRPSVEIIDDEPTLKTWSTNAQSANLKFLPTIQLFTTKGAMLEHYGAPGVAELKAGTLHSGTGDSVIAVRSEYRPICLHNANGQKKQVGYLQIQVSTKHEDEVIKNFILEVLLLAPFSALILGFFGYVFSGKAVQPVENTLLMLRRFVADAGHELNTPITVIEASLQTVEEMRRDEEDPSEILEVIARASARMKDLAGNLMTLARMESPELVSPKVPLQVNEMVVPLVQEFQELAKQKRINLVCDPVPSLKLLGHNESLSRMLSNLLNNAIRYTETGGSVTVSVAAQDDNIAFVIQDTGIGMPQDSLNHIFERFYRVDKSRSRAAGGSGLGLSIVKAIVESHKGTVKVESELGKGSRFTVAIPYIH